jgi:hypothetical protein
MEIVVPLRVQNGQGFLGRRSTVKIDEWSIMDAACQNGKIATDAFNIESSSGPVCKGVGVAVRIVYPHMSTSRKMLYSYLYL